MFSPYSDEESESSKLAEKKNVTKSKSNSKIVAKRQKKLPCKPRPKASYNQRKDVLYKRILRGCRKYYCTKFSDFTKLKSRHAGHFKDQS